MVGFPMIPRGVPKERLVFLELREKPGRDNLDPDDEREMEWYFTDTGEAIPPDDADALPSRPVAP